MKRKQLRLLTAVTIATFATIGIQSPAVAQNGSDMNSAEFERLHKELAPKAETWKTIPWHSNLLSAQKAAVEQRKPIFIWAMDGHPLGCT